MKNKIAKPKYKVFTNSKNEIIAVSTYAGKTVKGVAKCDPRDSFDKSKGEQLAIARCAAKIAEKRRKRAERKVAEAKRLVDEAQAYLERMNSYFSDAVVRETVAGDDLKTIEGSL